MPIRHPFPNVPGHIIKTKSIWFLPAYRVNRPLIQVHFIPGIFFELSPIICTCPFFLFTAAPCSIFPLCFSRKPVFHTGLFIKIADKFLRAVPRYKFNRAVFSAKFKSGRYTSHNLFPFVLCQFIFPKIKIIHAYLMNRFFI